MVSDRRAHRIHHGTDIETHRRANETADGRTGSVGDATRIVNSTVVIVGADIAGRLVMSGGPPIDD
jgi:hypothetical protein